MIGRPVDETFRLCFTDRARFVGALACWRKCALRIEDTPLQTIVTTFLSPFQAQNLTICTLLDGWAEKIASCIEVQTKETSHKTENNENSILFQVSGLQEHLERTSSLFDVLPSLNNELLHSLQHAASIHPKTLP